MNFWLIEKAPNGNWNVKQTDEPFPPFANFDRQSDAILFCNRKVDERGGAVLLWEFDENGRGYWRDVTMTTAITGKEKQ